MKIIKSFIHFYNKLSNFGKILVFIVFILMLIIFFKSVMPVKEGMTTDSKGENFLFKDGNDIYDDFYVGIYDHLLFNSIKNDFEVGTIINSSSPTSISIIADIGCGTGHHVAELSSKNLKVIGVDVSPSMIKEAKKVAPNADFKIGNALDNSLFNQNSLTHVLCLYFTLYYFKDKMQFFYNCMDWLMPGGYLIVHLVDRESFDPILPPGNPLYVVSPQKYAKERITQTKITFNDFVYSSNFNLDKPNNMATFDEKFKFNDGKVRKQQQKLYMEDTSTIINMAQEAGLILQSKVDLVKCAYENQYLYIFAKPN
jgi:SAM-dependent methyltransferase